MWIELHPINKIHRLDHIILWAIAVLKQVDRVEEWQADLKAEFLGTGGGGFELHYQSFADEHLLVVAGNHLVEALALPRVQSELLIAPLSSKSAGVLAKLRDIYEHWPEARDRDEASLSGRTSFVALCSHASEASPWAFPEATANGLVLAQALNLTDLRAEVVRVLTAARTASESARVALYKD